MERKATSRLTCTERYKLEVLEVGDCGRHEVEQFIHDCYAFAYNAELKSYLPKIMSLRNERGEISAALGYRKAGSDKLFLENYLQGPVENYLETIAGHPVNREDIIEVGNLASASAGGNRLLITALTGFLKGKRAKWVVFTATPALLNSFSRMGLHPYALSLADKAAVGSQADDWGSYYDQAPVVVAGNVMQAFAALEKMLQSERAALQYGKLSQDSYNVGLSRAS